MSFTDIIMGVKYPIKVLVLEQFENKLDHNYRYGRVLWKEIKADDGIVRSNYFVFKDDKDKVKLPAPDPRFYSMGDRVKKMIFLKIDRTTYWPVTNNGHELTVQIPHPVFETEDVEIEQDGKKEIKQQYKRDANNNLIPVIETVFEVDEKGEKIKGKDGKEIIKSRTQRIDYEPRVIFSSKILMKDGLVTFPAMVANQNYNVGEWLALENIKTQKLYKLKNWWANNAQTVVMIFGIMVIFLIVYYGLDAMGKISSANIQSMTQNTNAVVEAMKSLSGNGASTAAAKPPV